MTIEKRMRLEEAAEILGINIQTAWRWAREGRIPAVKLGGIYLIDPEKFKALLDGDEKKE